jgi:N-acetyl-anhydromuramyl-L-alanine amidase AmpD
VTIPMRDVRAAMPNYPAYCGTHRSGAVTGIAVHHSATAHPEVGVSTDDAASIFRYHVDVLGWTHGGYHYLVHPSGTVEYALDEHIPAFHAGFRDSDDRLGLERGQYWNNHLIAICLLGWFERGRVPRGGTVPIPDRFTTPSPRQWETLIALVQDVLQRYGLEADTVAGHRELAGCRTRCPGANVDLDALRSTLRARTGARG